MGAHVLATPETDAEVGGDVDHRSLLTLQVG
jgi:hypothetical protein